MQKAMSATAMIYEHDPTPHPSGMPFIPGEPLIFGYSHQVEADIPLAADVRAELQAAFASNGTLLYDWSNETVAFEERFETTLLETQFRVVPTELEPVSEAVLEEIREIFKAHRKAETQKFLGLISWEGALDERE